MFGDFRDYYVLASQLRQKFHQWLTPLSSLPDTSSNNFCIIYQLRVFSNRRLSYWLGCFGFFVVETTDSASLSLYNTGHNTQFFSLFKFEIVSLEQVTFLINLNFNSYKSWTCSPPLQM